ncbi:hypothetical protein FPV67DRAFT_1496920 [Lyophyllum atratum]|nr:hypothetical protein FPV67DRAFT_1496920 [Lyophyllum atratum]
MRKALQENLVLTDKINAVSPTQVASTAQLSRSARKKANEKKTSQAHQPAKDSPTIADVLAEVAKLSQRVMRIEEEYGILKTDNETLKAGTETLKAGTETLKAGTETLKAEVRTLKAEVSTLKAEVRALKADNRTLIARVEHLENIVHPLHQRVVLDKARDKLLDECNLSRSDYPDPEALLKAAKDKLKTLTPSPLSLSDPALRMIFLGGSVRDQGNSAAHDASPEDLGVAVLRSDLPNKQRDVLTEIYTYLTGEEPVLKSIV